MNLFPGVVMRCTKCDQTSCDCWIEIRCPSCGKKATTDRQPDDGDAPYIEAECPACAGEGVQSDG